MHYGRSIAALRQQHGISLENLAERLAISPCKLARVEANEIPTPDWLLHEVRHVTGVDVRQFADRHRQEAQT